MRNINHNLIHLIIICICIVRIYSYKHSESLYINHDVNEILHKKLTENIHKIAKRAIGDDTTVVYDGSGQLSGRNMVVARLLQENFFAF